MELVKMGDQPSIMTGVSTSEKNVDSIVQSGKAAKANSEDDNIELF